MDHGQFICWTSSHKRSVKRKQREKKKVWHNGTRRTFLQLMCYCQILSHTHIIFTGLSCFFFFLRAVTDQSCQLCILLWGVFVLNLCKLLVTAGKVSLSTSSCSQASFSVRVYELCIFIFHSRQILLTFYISDTVYCAFIKCGLLCVQKELLLK